jgi:lysophospholipase L1-like esterase
MSETIDLRRQLDQSIDADIAQRIAVHKARIASLRLTRATLMSLGRAEMTTPLVMLALGDSWFDYPLYGNGPLPVDTDVIAQMRSLGAVNPVILNVSHFGDATTDELSLPKQQRLVAALADPDNWLEKGKPDAILFSGGGNDIAGDRFCIYLDYNAGGSTGLDQRRLDGVFASIEASYLDLFAFRDQYAPGVPIFGHDYDFPVPNGAHPICAGPWLKPSLVFKGWTDVAEGARIIRTALLGFRALLQKLAADPKNNFHLVDTQGTLRPADWANELHPNPAGFKAIATAILAAVTQQA